MSGKQKKKTSKTTSSKNNNINKKSSVEVNKKEVKVKDNIVKEEIKNDKSTSSTTRKEEVKVTNNSGGSLASKIALLIVIIVILILLFLKSCDKNEKYAIKFDTNGGNAITEQLISKDGKIKRPSDPVREGYKFIGWFKDGEVYDFDTEVTSDMTIEARWEKVSTDTSKKEVTDLTLSQDNMSLTLDDESQLMVSFEPIGAEAEVVWSSSDEEIATVDSTGKIKALKEGTVTITVATKDGKYQKTCTITVGKSATTKPSTNKTTSTKTPAKTPAKGNNTTTTKKPTKTPTKTVTVTNVTIADDGKVQSEGTSISLTANISPKNATNKKLTWSSSDESIATVDKNGKVTLKKYGVVKITAKSNNGKTATRTITIYPNPALYKLVLIGKGSGFSPITYKFQIKRQNTVFTDWSKAVYNGIILTQSVKRYPGFVTKEGTAIVTIGDYGNFTIDVEIQTEV